MGKVRWKQSVRQALNELRFCDFVVGVLVHRFKPLPKQCYKLGLGQAAVLIGIPLNENMQR